MAEEEEQYELGGTLTVIQSWKNADLSFFVQELYEGVLADRPVLSDVFVNMYPSWHSSSRSPTKKWTKCSMNYARALYLIIIDVTRVQKQSIDYICELHVRTESLYTITQFCNPAHNCDVDISGVNLSETPSRRNAGECTPSNKYLSQVLRFMHDNEELLCHVARRCIREYDFPSETLANERYNSWINATICISLMCFEHPVLQRQMLTDYAEVTQIRHVFCKRIVSKLSINVSPANAMPYKQNPSSARHSQESVCMARLKIAGFDSRISGNLSASFYTDPHLCVAMYDVNGVPLRLRKPNLQEASRRSHLQTMYSKDEYVACIRGSQGKTDEEHEIVVERPQLELELQHHSETSSSSDHDVFMLFFTIYRRTNITSIFPSYQLVGMQYMRCTGTCNTNNTRVTTLMGPIGDEFSVNQYHPFTKDDKQFNIKVTNELVADEGSCRPSTVLTDKELRTVNYFIEGVFKDLLKMRTERGHEIDKNGSVTALSQSNPIAFLPFCMCIRSWKHEIVSTEFVSELFTRAFKRMGDPDMELLFKAANSGELPWARRRIEELIRHVFADFALLPYVGDALNGDATEQSLNILVTENGDCEDGAIAAYSVLMSLKYSNHQYENTSHRLLAAYINMNYTPAIANFRAKGKSFGFRNMRSRKGRLGDDNEEIEQIGDSISHTAAVLLPVDSTKFPVILETTAIAGPSLPLDAASEIPADNSYGLEQSKVLESLSRFAEIASQLKLMDFSAIDGCPLRAESPEKNGATHFFDLEDFYLRGVFVCSTEIGKTRNKARPTVFEWNHSLLQAFRTGEFTPGQFDVGDPISHEEPVALLDAASVLSPPRSMMINNIQDILSTPENVECLSFVKELHRKYPTEPHHRDSNISAFLHRTVTFFMVSSKSISSVKRNTESAISYLKEQKDVKLDVVVSALFTGSIAVELRVHFI